MIRSISKNPGPFAVAFASLLLLAPGVAAKGLRTYLSKPDAWFAGAEAKRIAANILTYQADLGGWPKNIDTASAPYRGELADLKPTFDNGATTDELRFLARVVQATKDERCRTAVEKGVDYILRAQYDNGGWPQYYPPPKKSYHRYITFNDDAMVRLLEFLREMYTSEVYDFLGAERRAAGLRARHCLHPEVPDQGGWQADGVVRPARRERLAPPAGTHV